MAEISSATQGHPYPECYVKLADIAAAIGSDGEPGGTAERHLDPTSVAVRLAKMFINSRDYQVQKYVMFGILECHTHQSRAVWARGAARLGRPQKQRQQRDDDHFSEDIQACIEQFLQFVPWTDMVTFESKTWDELLRLGHPHGASDAHAGSPYVQQLHVLAAKCFTEMYNQYDVRISVAKMYGQRMPRLHLMAYYFSTRNPA